MDLANGFNAKTQGKNLPASIVAISKLPFTLSGKAKRVASCAGRKAAEGRRSPRRFAPSLEA
jgi:hypothetical protein